jgi:glutamate dehydrogenase/leucine dehydrogenase/acyl-CoA synthetase (NDP forming)/uridine kinase
MIRKFPIGIRIISGILLVAFLCQDILWANPEMVSSPASSLQIQPISRGIFNDAPALRKLIEARLLQICSLEDPSNVYFLVRELKRRRLALPSVEKNITLLFDFSKAKYSRKDKEWRVPCSASSPGKRRLKYSAFIGHDGLKDVVLAGEERPAKTPPQEKPVAPLVPQVIPKRPLAEDGRGHLSVPYKEVSETSSKPPSIMETAEVNIKNAAETLELGSIFVDRRLPQEQNLLSRMFDRFIPRNILLNSKRVTTVKFTVYVEDEDGALEPKTFYGFRVLQNDARGAGKGGLRWLVVKGETLEEARATAEALAISMIIKTGVVGVPFGGGKGDIVVDSNYDDKPDDKARIMRGFARALTEEEAIGTFSDVPAPDQGTDAKMMAWFLDEHLRVLTERGDIQDKTILEGLKYVRPAGSSPRIVPYLAEYACILDGDTKSVLHGLELGAITGKPVWSDDLDFRKDEITGWPIWKGEIGYEAAKTIRVGGSEGREKATGYGGFLALKAIFKYLPSIISPDNVTVWRDLVPATKELLKKDSSAMTVGVQGTGNVGEYNDWEFHHARSKIKLLQDVHWTIFNADGIDIGQMNKPENLPRKNGKWALENIRQNFLDNTGTRIVEYKDRSSILYKEDGIDMESFIAALDEYLPKDEKEDRPQFDTLDKDRQNEFLRRTGTVKRDISFFWTEHTNIKVPAATENVITEAVAGIANCEIVLELANSPTTPAADVILRERGILVIPDILANVGGVTVSYFEWLQNIEGRYWHEISVDKMLEERIDRETRDVLRIARKYDTDLRSASFILALTRIVDAEIARSWKLWAILKLRKIITRKGPYRYYGELGHDPDTVEELSLMCRTGKFGDLITRDEARHKEEIDGYVKQISVRFEKNRRGFVLVSGPRTSGKTIFSERIRDGLNWELFNAIHLDIDVELDEYEKELQASSVIGEEELYNAKSMRMRSLLEDLLAGKDIEIRRYEDGRVVWFTFKLGKDQTLVLEGDYALSDEVKEILAGEQTFRYFVNPATSMKLGGNWPLTSLDLRFMRHILTFANVLKAQHPLDIIREWPKIRGHDLAYVYKTWKNADVTFNSYLSYELPVLKPYIEPLLNEALDEARRRGDAPSINSIEHLLLMLKEVPSAAMNGKIPADSILRQFIGKGGRGSGAEMISAISYPQSPPRAAEAVLHNAQKAGREFLYEHETYELWRGAGISTPEYEVVSKETIESLAAAGRRERARFFKEIISRLPGKSIAVKVIADDVFHKGKAGGVKFVRRSPRAVASAARRMARHFEANEFKGVLICEKVPYDIRAGEFLVGITHDPQFGPVVTFGAGGAVAEAEKDVSRRLIPDPDDDGDWELFGGAVRRMIDETKIGRRLPIAKKETLARSIRGICELTRLSGDYAITELDVNPLVLDGAHGAFALDGVLTFNRRDAMPYFSARQKYSKLPRNLHKLFNPERVAIIGGNTARSLTSHIEKIIGKEGCSIRDLFYMKNTDGEIPYNLDLALIASIDEKVPAVMRALVDKKKNETDKTLALVIISGGFAEFDPQGESQQGLIAAAAYAKENGVTLDILGPNTIGIDSGYPGLFVPHEKMDVPRADGEPKEALIFQSGGVLTAYIDFHPGANIDFVAGTGNAFDLGTADLLAGVLIERPDIKIIRLYIEGLKEAEGRRLCELVDRAVHRGSKEVRVYLAGTTEEGRKAAISHTAALSPSIAVAMDALREAGATFERRLVDEPFDYKTMLPRVGPMQDAETVALIGNSGGQGVIAAEGLGRLKFLEPSGKTLAELERLRSENLLPTIFRPGHPFDITGAGLDEHLMLVTETVLEHNKNIDALVIAYAPASPVIKGVRGMTELPSGCALPHIVQLARERNIPIVVSLTGREENWSGIIKWLNENNVAYTQNAAQAIRLLEMAKEREVSSAKYTDWTTILYCRDWGGSALIGLIFGIAAAMAITAIILWKNPHLVNQFFNQYRGLSVSIEAMLALYFGGLRGIGGKDDRVEPIRGILETGISSDQQRGGAPFSEKLKATLRERKPASQQVEDKTPDSGAVAEVDIDSSLGPLAYGTGSILDVSVGNTVHHRELSAGERAPAVDKARNVLFRPMIRPPSEISIEDAKAALSSMRIDERYGCAYIVGEDGALKFTAKADTPQGWAFARLLNDAARRLRINIQALPGDIRSEIMRSMAGLRAHQATAPPEIGVANGCPFTSVRRAEDDMVLFDLEMTALLIKIMNDRGYENYKARYGHVIDWLISERLFHEIFHAPREKEQTIRDIHYYYLPLNTSGMKKSVEEFFDLPLVKDSKIAQKTKIRFKFIERQAWRLMNGKAINKKKVSRFLGPYKNPIQAGPHTFEGSVDYWAYHDRDLSKDDELTRGFLEALLSNTLHKKTVFAFSDSLGKKNGRPLRILETVKELKRDPLLKHLFKNVEIVICPAKRIHNKVQKYFGDPNTQVFTFVNNEEEPDIKGLKNKNPVRIFYIDDAQLGSQSGSQLPDSEMKKIYYPLLEVVTISLFDYTEENIVDNIPNRIKQAIGIESIKRRGDGLVFVLTLPKSKRHDIEDTVVKRYERLQKLLRFA